MELQSITVEHVWNPNWAEAEKIVHTTRPYRLEEANWMREQLVRLFKKAPSLFSEHEVRQMNAIIGGIKHNRRGDVDRVEGDVSTIMEMLECGDRVSASELCVKFRWSKNRTTAALMTLVERHPEVQRRTEPEKPGSKGRHCVRYFLEGV